MPYGRPSLNGGVEASFWRVVSYAAEQLPAQQDHADVDASEEGGEEAIDEASVDDPVDVIEAEAKDRNPGTDGITTTRHSVRDWSARWRAAAALSIPSGLRGQRCCPPIGPGVIAATTHMATRISAAAQATGRHRGVGSRPVGKSNVRNVTVSPQT